MLFTVWLKPTIIFVENNTTETLTVNVMHHEFLNNWITSSKQVGPLVEARLGVRFGLGRAILVNAFSQAKELPKGGAQGRCILKDLLAAQFGFFWNSHVIEIDDHALSIQPYWLGSPRIPVNPK